MLNTFLNTFKAGTQILLQQFSGSTIINQEVATISSIRHYNKDLYDVEFEESKLKGCYCFSKEQLDRMRIAFIESSESK